ncbi:MAG: DUF2905 domain-containing protein [Candidatus Dormibacteria bacterium]
MSVGDLGKWLVIAGVAIAVIGGILIVARRVGLGQLPGDVTVRSGGYTVFVPVVTCIVISVVLTVVINIVLRLGR